MSTSLRRFGSEKEETKTSQDLLALPITANPTEQPNSMVTSKSAKTQSSLNFNDNRLDYGFNSSFASGRNTAVSSLERRQTFSRKIAVNDGKLSLRIVEKLNKNYDVFYKILGQDSIGNIKVERRYQDFRSFRDILVLRYPGVFIPPISPPKINKNDTIEERYIFLNEFLQNVSKLPYLAGSAEIQVFLRVQKVRDTPVPLEDAFRQLER